MFFVMTLRLSDHTEVLHNIATSSSFFRFRWGFLAFLAHISNLIKQLFHSHLLDIILVIATKQGLTSMNRREPVFPLVLPVYGVGFGPTNYEQCLHLSE